MDFLAARRPLAIFFSQSVTERLPSAAREQRPSGRHILSAPSFGPCEADSGHSERRSLVTTSPDSVLPPRPSLALLSNLAKQLRKAHDARDPAAIARLKQHHPRFKS